MKKLIIAVVIIFVIAGLLFLGYYLRSQKESAASPATAGGENLPTVQLPEIAGNTETGAQTVSATGNLMLAVDAPAIDYFVDEKNAATFVRMDGQILKTGASGSEPLSANVVNNISNVSFSFDGKKVLMVMGGSSGNQASVFDAASKEWRPLPQGINAPAWSPDNYQIAYFSSGPGGNVLSSLDAGSSASKPKALLPLHQKDATLDWFAPNQLLIADKASAAWNSSLWSFDLAKKIISPVIQDKPGLETIWSSSPAPLGLAFSANRTQRGGALQLVDASGNSLERLSFLTLPSKCVFYGGPVVAAPDQAAGSAATNTGSPTSGGSTSSLVASGVLKPKPMLICAVPRDQQLFGVSALPDAYQEKVLFTSDDFFEINVGNGTVKTLFDDPAKNLDASDLKVFNQNLYFINRFDKKVYSVSLAP